MTQVSRLLPSREIPSLVDYEATGGGTGLATAIQLEPEEVVELIRLSGLRGRGGAGFPTGVKWDTIRTYASRTDGTPVVVNAAEGEPGTFKDRILLRRNPWAVLEGALIAALAVGSTRVRVATKSSFDLEIDRLERAIAEVRQAGWLDGLEVTVDTGPSEYLFGEETGLLEVLEGRPPFPRVTPPWRRGIEGGHPENAHTAAGVQMAEVGGSPSAPALVDNVETLANVAMILANGVDWFRSVGTEESPGTILCTVTGATARHGVGEFALGTPLREVIEVVGGGTRPDHQLRAVLSGVSNPPLGVAGLDTPLSYEAMRDAGSGLGSASLIVVDETVPLRQVAADVARFLSIESCGQCDPCKRDGLAVADGLGRRDAGAPVDVSGRLATVTRGARCALAGQVQTVVGALLALDAAQSDLGVEDRGAATSGDGDADLVAIVPLVEIDGERAVLDLGHRRKAPDWTHDRTAASRNVWPIQRLADRPVEQASSTTGENRHAVPAAPGDPADTIDPMAVISAMDARIDALVTNLETAAPADRDDARGALREMVRRHLDLVEHIIYPLLDRLRDDGADLAAYPDRHAREAYALLAPDGSSGADRSDREALSAIRRAVDEVQLRVVPLLRDGLDEAQRSTVASALVAEASLQDFTGADQP